MKSFDKEQEQERFVADLIKDDNRKCPKLHERRRPLTKTPLSMDGTILLVHEVEREARPSAFHSRERDQRSKIRKHNQVTVHCPPVCISKPHREVLFF
ncbi:hypothetical protein J6590_049695 [Homalodisca vitripennis]|nr:hypothetical protein J6590_049695 [Homalodisca vitripennis]